MRMSDLMLCPHCGSVAEYVSEHAKGKKWAVACTMTSKVAADEGKPMCRCCTPFFRDKGQARDIWNRRAADTRVAELESQCEKLQIVADCVDERNRRFFEVESERDELQAVLDERGTHIAKLTVERGAYFEMVKRVQADCDARDELTRDLYDNLWTHAPKCAEAFAERMRELGIEVDSV